MAALSGKRRTRGGEDLRNTKTLSPARNTCRACRLSMQRGSGCGADRNVPFGQTVDLAQRLREQKVYFEEVIFPDEIHDFLIWRNWVRAYGASVDFFDKELR